MRSSHDSSLQNVRHLHRLAEAGCSANVIASISGHTTLAEVARYTKAADQQRMARDGMAAIS
jgi:hypothetical protein